MKRIRRFVAASVIAGLMGTGIPMMAAQQGRDNRGAVQYQAANHRGDQRNGNQDRNFRTDDRAHGYAPVAVYQSAPVYSQPAYGYGYYDQRTHDGRTAAIIGGSAAAGALIGAATDHGEGAVIGAIIGGVAGAAVSAAADHHAR